MSENALYLNGVPLYYTDRKAGRIPKEVITDYFKSDRFKAQQGVIPALLIPHHYVIELTRLGRRCGKPGALTIDVNRSLGVVKRVYAKDDNIYVDLILHNEELFDDIDGGGSVVTPSLLVSDGRIQSAFAFEVIPNPECN